MSVDVHELVQRVRPVYAFTDCKRGGRVGLHYLPVTDPYDTVHWSSLVQRKDLERAGDLAPLIDVFTVHRLDRRGCAHTQRDWVAEVLVQLPRRHLRHTVAFEMLPTWRRRGWQEYGELLEALRHEMRARSKRFEIGVTRLYARDGHRSRGWERVLA